MAGLLLTVLAAMTFSACGARSHEGSALREEDDASRVSMRFSNPGEPHFFGLIELRPLGSRPVHVLGAEMIGVPRGFVVDGIWGVRLSEIGEFPLVLRGAGQAARLRPLYHALAQIVVDPRCPPEALCQPRAESGPRGTPLQDWGLLLECHIDRPGDFEIPGFQVFYEVGGHRQRQRFLKAHFELHSGESPE